MFCVESPDPESHFFLAFFSSSGRRFTLVNPPSHIDLSLGAQLKASLPRKITTDHVEQSNLRVIEVKRKIGNSGIYASLQMLPTLKLIFILGPEVDYPLFLAHILKILNHLGFDLDATIPLPKRQSLGLRSSQEIMVFKGRVPG